MTHFSFLKLWNFFCFYAWDVKLKVLNGVYSLFKYLLSDYGGGVSMNVCKSILGIYVLRSGNDKIACQRKNFVDYLDLN